MNFFPRIFSLLESCQLYIIAKYKASNCCKIEEVIQRCSVKKMLLKILQNLQENPRHGIHKGANANNQANSSSQGSFRQETSITSFDSKQFNDVKGVKNFRKTLSLSRISRTDSKVFTGTR